MNRENKKISSIVLRYLLLLVIAIPNLYLFYLIFTPLTIYPVYFLLGLLYPVFLSGSLLTVNGFQIQIIDACIAGSAYFLLVLLNFSFSMPIKKRISSLIFSLFSFLFLNILRIFIF
jgi:exosortase/archaeosortase